MHQIICPKNLSANKRDLVVHKRTLENEDLQIVADMVSEGLREGLYAEIVPGKKRRDILRFLQHLVKKCEIRKYDQFGNCVGRRVAALWVYTAKGEVIGFGVLGQIFASSMQNGFHLTDEFDQQLGTDADHVPIVPGRRLHYDHKRGDLSRLPAFTIVEEGKPRIKNGVELLMLGVTASQRGCGYGAAILDHLINGISHRYFDLLVRCPNDLPLLFAMFSTRGFVAAGRYCQSRILRFFPPPEDGSARPNSIHSRYCE